MAVLGLALLSGCASGAQRESDPRDPLEPYNRAVYRFNSDFDKAFMQPLARAYRTVTPEPVDRGVTNFFANLADVNSAINNALQFKMSRAGSDVGRVVINSTVGVLGVFDVATNMGLPSYKEDFGQTLGYWGVESGAYFMLPLLGPSSLRDTLGLAGDMLADPLVSVREHEAYWGAIVVRTIDGRADLLSAGEILDEAALDPYSFLRDAYLQRRQSLVHDGDPPVESDFWDEMDFDEAPEGAR